MSACSQTVQGSPAVTRVSRRQAARMLGISERQITSWQRAGFVAGGASLNVPEVAQLRRLFGLTQRMSVRSIRSSLAAMQQLLGGSNPMHHGAPLTHGSRLLFRHAGALLDPLTQQLGFDFEGGTCQTLQLSVPTVSLEVQQRHQLMAQDLFQRAVRLEEQPGQIEAAAECYRQAIHLSPRHAAAHINLGTILYNARNYAEAEEQYRVAVEIDPDYALAYFDLGNVLDEMRRLPEAIAAYQRAVQLVPHYADAHYNLALALERIGERRRALRHWMCYLRVDPVGPWATHARIQSRRTLASERLSIVARGGKLA